LKKELEDQKRIAIEQAKKEVREEYERKFRELLEGKFKMAFVVEGQFAEAAYESVFASGTFTNFSTESGIFP